MAWLCEQCGKEFDAAPAASAGPEWNCPECGSPVELQSTEVSPPPTNHSGNGQSDGGLQVESEPVERAEKASAAVRDIRNGPADTVFQPVLMMESIMDELQEPQPAAVSRSTEPGTEALDADTLTLPSPFLELDVDAYLLILGASPGQERRALVRAKTTFGRNGADVLVEDNAISSQHFQIEAFGNEFFVRDLDSRNGTFLNGTQVRYSQLLPGDQITAGKTTLMFRTSSDLIDRS